MDGSCCNERRGSKESKDYFCNLVSLVDVVLGVGVIVDSNMDNPPEIWLDGATVDGYVALVEDVGGLM